MAVLSMQFYAKTLGMHTTITAILPSETSALEPDDTGFYQEGKKYQVLYLLHGATGDSNVWLYNTRIAFYAQQHKLAVICASVGNSYYQDMKYGPAYYSFMAEELPKVAKAFFPISKKAENTFIAGISMGGYGAMRIGLTKPDCYSRIGTISGGLDVEELADGTSTTLTKQTVRAAFGEHPRLRDSELDLLCLLREYKEQGKKPVPVFQSCGTGDFLYETNVKYRGYMEELGVDLTYEEGPGEHTWDYWDPAISRFLEWLPLENKLVDE